MTPDKQAMRQQALQTLRGMTPQRREEASAALRRRLAQHLEGRTPCTLGIYAPLPHEVDLLPLLREMPQHTYAFPVAGPQRRMCFRAVRCPEEELQPARFGLREPLPTCPALPPASLDLIVIPGLAFTADGARLGYGGGYYDSFLPLCPQAERLSLAFAEQMLPYIPTEPHDLPVPLIFTA